LYKALERMKYAANIPWFFDISVNGGLERAWGEAPTPA
jgi:hypothetical protein